MFSKAKIAQLKAKFSSIDTNDISNSGLRAKAARLKAKQGGFTLLELLVVVAILAAIAGTATIALQDTDARASAAAHVAMMDELNKGIRTFRVLNRNALPTNFDSLLQTPAADGQSPVVVPNDVIAISDFTVVTLPTAVAAVMNAGGINSLRYLHADATANPDDAGDCGDIPALIASRGNAVVAGNIFMSPAANGCGYPVAFDGDGEILDAAGAVVNAGDTTSVAIWNGGYERVLGGAGVLFDVTPVVSTTRPALMAVGLGPSSSLFNANDLGGLTSVPVYRHVSGQQYNRFIALFNIGTLDTAGTVITPNDQVALTAIVDGAGDTKEEELGEWDGTRNTI
jgi:prepilin-type N-terminal cleavage/methylation domain-containing protein